MNDRALQSIAILDRDHVLVPMRAIFESLHAPLPQGHLKGSKVIAGRTFIPIRTAAGILGATVYYDGHQHLVSVYSQPATPLPSPSPIPVSGLRPAPNSRVASAYPTISAALDLDPDVFIQSLRLHLDGEDYSSLASYDGVYVTFIPRHGLQPGTHDVVLDGTSSENTPFHVAWQFDTTLAPQPDTNDAYEPNFSGPYGFSQLQLTVFADQIFGGSPLNVQLVGPPNGRAYAFICSSPWEYELYSAPQSPFYNGTLPTPRTDDRYYCPVTAMFVAPNGAVTYAPYPQTVELLPLATPEPARTPSPSPQPTRVYPQPIATHSPQPKPTATPMPTQTPKPTAPPTAKPTPFPHPSYRPLPLPLPHPVHPVETATPRPEPVETTKTAPHPRATPSPREKPEPRRTPPAI